MPKIPLESENCVKVDGPTLQRPLLSDSADEEVDDEEIVSQLLSTNERSNRRRRCRKFVGGPLWALLFALFTLLGLFASVWATCSCNLIAIQWNKGGVHLTVTAVGFFSYQRDAVDPQHKNESANAINQVTKEVCVDYGAVQQVGMQKFFPSNQTLQVYSILGPSFYFAAILAMLMFMLILSMHPEVLTQSETEQYPATGLAITVTMASVFLLVSGIFQLLSVHGLLHYSDNNTNDQSPICNPTYSTCHLGPGGNWAVFAIFSSFFCGLVSCLAAYFVGCRTGRSTRCCGR